MTGHQATGNGLLPLRRQEGLQVLATSRFFFEKSKHLTSSIAFPSTQDQFIESGILTCKDGSSNLIAALLQHVSKGALPSLKKSA